MASDLVRYTFDLEWNSQKQFTVVLLLVILNCSQRRGGHCRKWSDSVTVVGNYLVENEVVLLLLSAAE